MKAILFLGLLALAPRPARAIFCSNAAVIEAQMELCDDNAKLAQAGEACRNEYLKAVRAEQDRLGKELRKGAQAAGTQNVSEGVSAATYDSTIARLDTLIARGEATHKEEFDYVAHFILPFHWPRELGPMPAKSDPELWKAYDGEFCFGEHRETITHMVADIDQAVADLKKARAEAVALKGGSSANQAHLGNDAGKAAAGTHGKGSGSVKGAGSKNGASDITGVEQDKKKQMAPPAQMPGNPKGQ
jgi:hypothetical protein